MIPNLHPLIQQIVIPAMLTFFLLGGIVGLLFGLGLLARSEMVLGWGDTMNRWVSFRQVLKPAEVTHDSWSAVQRNRRWLAVVITAGGLFTIYSLFNMDMDAIARNLAGRWSLRLSFVSWMVVSARWFLTLGNLVGVGVGLMLGFAPDLLAKVEKLSGRWYSTRNAMRTATVVHIGFDQWVSHSPRVMGVLLALFSVVEIYCVVRVMH